MTNNDVNFIQIFGVIKILQYICILKNLNVNQMVNAYCDIKNSVDTAKREGLAEGIEIGMNQKDQDIAKNMLAMGLSAEQVAKATQLSLEIIKNLSNS